MSALARRVLCDYCGSPIVLAACFDGRHRTFDPHLVSPRPTGTWAWLRGRGMTETPDLPGHRLHWCSEFDRVRPEDLDLQNPFT